MASAKISRRNFVKRSVAAAPMAGLFPHMLTSKSRARKPNLLFLWTDEQRADTMKAYGNPVIHAPNLNKLATECVVFDKAYVTQPVCTPSRSTVMTGLWPHQNGCVQNNVALQHETPTLPKLIGDADYRTGYFGKWHLGDEIFAQHGFEEWRSIEDTYREYYGDDRDTNARSSYHHFLRELGYEPGEEDGVFGRGFAARLPIEHCKPRFLEQETCAFLDRHRNEPFILYVNFLEPHMPFYGPLNNEHDPSMITLPANFDDPLEDNEPETYRQRRQNLLDRDDYDGHDLKTEAGWRNLIARYWGLVTQVDRSVGAILERLERLGLADDTIIVYTSDHGDMMGSHKMLAKSVMYEEATRVPWLMRVPGMGRNERHIACPVSHIDLVPTLLEIMGAKRDHDLPGKSLRRLMRGKHAGADEVYIQWTDPDPYTPGRNPYGRSRIPQDPPGNHVRTVVSPEGWKLSIHTADKNQLFDLRADPGETTNIYDIADSHAVIQRLTQSIRSWQERVSDTLSLEGC